MKLIRRMISYLRDHEKDLSERSIVLMTILAIIGVFVILIGDIIVGEYTEELIVLGGTLFIVPLITFFSVSKKRVKLGINLISFGTVFVILPVTFYFGGGLRGGAIIWIIFAYMYIGVIMSGHGRRIMLIILTGEAVINYLVDYFFPDVVRPHNNKEFYLDSVMSIVVVGFLIYTMMWFLIRLFDEERKRAQDEAKRAEEAIRAQNQFFSSMSHEIRTPINTVLGLNEIILRQEDASDEIRRDAKNIQGAGKMLLALINDILDVSKIEAGKMDIVPVSYDVGTLVSELVNMIWIKADEKGLKFKVDIDPSIPTKLFGDEVRVKQVLINLLNNAVKYTKEGSVTFHMECEKEDKDHVLLKASISDTGMGIKSEAIPHLFDSFQRVDEEKNRHIEGTGLGLSIVKQLVDLMGGDISVNSIYGHGSTFVVSLSQRIENEEVIGNLNIAGGDVEGEKFEHMFSAPSARALIVDDNEMNLQVESKLLDGTEMTVDLSLSAADALKKTVKYHYDIIFLDHLMPEMDGIECYHEIRKQVGGLNKTTPIVVLTANVGGENKELYDQAGFDAYLMKPISGVLLEETVIRFVSQEKINLNTENEMTKTHIDTAGAYSKKQSVVITTSTMCDLPQDVIKNLDIPRIPFMVYTDYGVFWDSVEIEADEMVRYMSDENNTVASDAPSEEDFMTFFSNQLKNAHHVIHIALTTSMSEEYERASAAAKNFDNVSVVNSEVLSSSLGFLVLSAVRMVQRGESVERILKEIEDVKRRIHCSFVIASTDFLSRAGHINSRVNSLLKALWVRPSLRIKDDKFGLDRLMTGNTYQCYEKYIRRAIPKNANPDKDLLFVTYVDMSEEDLNWIVDKVRVRTKFKRIVFQKASSAISANCGPGAFGLLYMDKGKITYNLGSFIPEQIEEDELYDEDQEINDLVENVSDTTDTLEDKTKIPALSDESSNEEKKPKDKYHSLAGIDADKALKNSGSEDALQSVMQIFYDSMDTKEKELKGYFAEQDWENYTIKIHALKSSAKLIGAMDLSEDAQALETAGKENNIDFILENHERVMEEYMAFKDVLKEVVTVAEDEPDDADDDSPEIGADELADIYASIRGYAGECDDMGIEEELGKLDGYRVVDEEKEKVSKIREALDAFDFDLISELLG